MNQKEIDQVKTIITNFEEQKGYIPYLYDLESHPVFGAVFQSLHAEDKEDVKKHIDEYIVEKLEGLKTKGGQLFRRFFEVDEKLFWQFRDLNSKEENVTSDEFQKVGKKVEDEMFKYEGILTEKMIDQEKGLDKVMGSFYNIVHCFFPRFSKVE